jgi:7,8-dihydropterin-6-yl-methyl-4-(beta-D-ribofuranosyl)aminobenzene 5'-phosphate synthase
MRVKILYDNEAITGFESGWGFSCLLELDDKNILFDTGRDGEILLDNMKRMGISKEDIEIIVLSHRHMDHVGGLPHVVHRGATVYFPASFPDDIKENMTEASSAVEVRDFAKINEGVYTTGELGTSILEQSLLVESDKGLVLVTGCAHPGLGNIIDFAEGHGDVSCVVGGFHVFDELERLKGMRLISPCHCTSRKLDIRRIYPEASLECAAGRTIEI